MTRDITCVALDLTTVCDRACPDCCCGINMGLRPAVHHDVEYFERAAQVIRGNGIERLHVTGGEPTTHPQFAAIVPRLKEMFGVQRLTLQTDAFATGRHAETLKHFDHIYASRYGEKNRRAVDVLVSEFGATTWDGEFTPRTRRGSGKPCARGTSETVAFADGKFWPCCVAPGIPGATSLSACQDWRGLIESVPLACSDCWFSE